MIPVMFMPAFVQKLSVFSPVYWSIRSLEGAIWRDFSWGELMLPWSILVLVGAAGLLLGTRIIMRQS
jgi:ABC-2 type transport system permease protein